MRAMSWRGMIAAALAVIVAAAIIAVIATVADEVGRRQGAATSTPIPAPEVVILKCVRGMDGFYCAEVTEECR